MSEYTIVKPCFLGESGTVSLNPRQAANLLAGGFIAAVEKKKTAKKVTGNG